MDDTKEKIRSLFYSTDEKNRNLAFELARGANIYEEMINEFYNAFQEIPAFEAKKEDWLEMMEEIREEEREKMPESPIELKRAQVEGFCYAYFYEELSLKVNYSADESLKLNIFPKVLLNCSFITHLDLSWHDIKVLPEEISQMTNLIRLDLSCNNELRDLPDSLGDLQQLESLSFYGIPGIFSYRTYRYEDPERDEYDYKWPDCLRRLKNLRNLDLGDVLIRDIPEWIPELTNLESLWIFSGWGSHPPLQLPDSFTQLSKLITLQINAYSTHIPPDIGKMQSLEVLIVEPALSIPESIKNLKNLKILDFSYLSFDYPVKTDTGFKKLYDAFSENGSNEISRIALYGWEWIKEMTWLKEFVFKHIPPYAFTELEIKELEEALPNCKLILED